VPDADTDQDTVSNPNTDQNADRRREDTRLIGSGRQPSVRSISSPAAASAAGLLASSPSGAGSPQTRRSPPCRRRIFSG
jgi:hypothetical protein